jgi:ElaB/YqjD/DUF883 family membrane-anchored ribosome-binding protein
MSSTTDTDFRSTAGKKHAATSSATTEDLAEQIEAIRADVQNLTSTLKRVANKQVGHAQDLAMEKAQEAEEAIRQNPLSAVAIAAGLGFVFGVFTRR